MSSNNGKKTQVPLRHGRFWFWLVKNLRYAPGALVVHMALLWLCILPAYGIDLADAPLAAQLAASAPNLMFGLDDSGSMDWETLTEDGVYRINGAGTTYEYLWDMSDNVYGSTSSNGNRLTGSNRLYYRSQWFEHNVMYYNPNVTYTIWANCKDDDGDPVTFSISLDSPRSHPTVSSTTLAMDGDYYVLGSVHIRNAHYYVKTATGVYLINLTGTGGAYTTEYYSATISSNKVTGLTGPLSDAAADTAGILTGRSASDARQNFAIWWSFYRRRTHLAVSIIGELIPRLAGMQVGIRSINGKIKQAVLPVQVGGQDETASLRYRLYSFRQKVAGSAGTPLRLGLQKIGQYYHTSQSISPSETVFNTSPIDTGEGGDCQQNFAIMFTDGAYNGGDPSVGNADNTSRTIGDHPVPAADPYRDSDSNTLADVAYYYWATDLDGDLTNNMVPVHDPPDPAYWQHMVTYTVSFGLTGTLNPDNYTLYCGIPANCNYPSWPGNVDTKDEKIDDLWHAAVNGRGQYLSASNPVELYDSFADILADVGSRVGTAASVSLNGDKLMTDLTLYQSKYNTAGWVGFLFAYPIDTATGLAVETASIDFQAKLDAASWSNRKIVTYSGSGGIPFQKDSMAEAQWQLIDSDPVEAQEKINYIRGDRSNEGEYRIRQSILGDIIHSAPYYNKYSETEEAIFVGANDGMLHVFDANSGEEIFGYVPGMVTENLSALTDFDYSHKYFVDQTVFIKKNVPIGGNAKSLLLGGLGKGGKGYYCLDVTDIFSPTTELEFSDLVRWEYPGAASDADMGYSYGTAYAVKTNASTDPWKVIFANGYDSGNQHAVLYILNLDGSPFKKIDTGVGVDNGLSSPNVAYADDNDTVDYVYAGDLKGNIWKFDLTSSNTTNWKVAYYEGTTPKPLFTATDENDAPQPITVRPVVIGQCRNGLPGYMVIFATGKNLGTSDLSDEQTQSLYGVWDYGDDDDDEEYLGTFDRDASSGRQLSGPLMAAFSTLLEQTIMSYEDSEIGEVRVVSARDANYVVVDDDDGFNMGNPNPSDVEDNHVGWFIDLPSTKEKVNQNPMVRTGLAYFISYIPETAHPCEAGGESWLWEINACSGGRNYRAVFDTNNDHIIDENDVVVVEGTSSTPQTEDPNDPSTWSGERLLTPSAVHFDQGVYMPAFVAAEDQDLKFMSDSAGGTRMLRNVAEGRGITYWREK